MKSDRIDAEPFSGYEDHYLALGRFAYLISGDLEASRDLTQEALIRAARAGVDFGAPEAGPYLRAVVVNLWRRRFRRLRSEARAILRMRPPSPPPLLEEAVAERDAVWRALRRLSYDTRVCLVLRYYEDLPLSGIAAELGRPVGTVKSLVARGLRRMGQLLEEKDGRP